MSKRKESLGNRKEEKGKCSGISLNNQAINHPRHETDQSSKNISDQMGSEI